MPASERRLPLGSPTLPRATRPPSASFGSRPPRKLAFARRENGTLTAAPAEVDAITTAAWARVYEGNAGQTPVGVRDFVASFLTEHGHLFPAAPPHQLPPLSTEALWQALREAPETAAGMDGWRPSELATVSWWAADYLRRMLLAIEGGAPWPAAFGHAKAVFLAKTEDLSLNALDNRILLICSAVYRRWGALRLKHLGEWIGTWRTDAMFAGVPGAGADMATWLFARHLEESSLRGQHVSAMAVDIYKCFDQIVRQLVVCTAARAGCPLEVVGPWYRLMQGMQCYNLLAEGVGEGYAKPCSIPQGCPFSMMWLALLSTGLERTVRAHHCRPRVLADDWLVSAAGEDHDTRLKAGAGSAHGLMHSMGARVAPAKCGLLSTEPRARKALATHRWPHLATTVPVVNHMRDLGAHVDFTRQRKGVTLTKRLKLGLSLAHAVRALPRSTKGRAKLLRTKVLPGALYGAPPRPSLKPRSAACAQRSRSASCLGTPPTRRPTSSSPSPLEVSSTLLSTSCSAGSWP